MKATVNPEVENTIADIARRHGLSREAVALAMLGLSTSVAVTMAEFSISRSAVRSGCRAG